MLWTVVEYDHFDRLKRQNGVAALACRCLGRTRMDVLALRGVVATWLAVVHSSFKHMTHLVLRPLGAPARLHLIVSLLRACHPSTQYSRHDRVWLV